MYLKSAAVSIDEFQKNSWAFLQVQRWIPPEASLKSAGIPSDLEQKGIDWGDGEKFSFFIGKCLCWDVPKGWILNQALINSAAS